MYDQLLLCVHIEQLSARIAPAMILHTCLLVTLHYITLENCL